MNSIKIRPLARYGPELSINLKLFGCWLMSDIYWTHGIIAVGRKLNYRMFNWKLRLPRKIRWMYLVMFPPKCWCPKCGRTKYVSRGRDTSTGRKVFRCLSCFVKYDNFYRRYPWTS